MIDQTLSHFKILQKLGAGGMGEVYKATDTRLDRIVAIKVLPEQFSSDPGLRQRLEREARSISSLNHPHICTLYEFDTHEEIDFLVMEYLEGETLASRLAGAGALPLDEALRYAVEIAGAMAAAHGQGIIHRDLKPGNVMLTESGAKLLDFGLAKPGPMPVADHSQLVTELNPLTAEHTIVGTLPYMAPEQLKGQPVDARTDLFAFGAVFYEMVTGRRAFEGETRAELTGAILERDPPSLSALQPKSPPALDRTVQRCLAKDPMKRWHSAHDLADELRWISALAEESPEPPARGVRWRWIAAGVLVGATLGALVTWQLHRSGDAGTPAITYTQLGVQPADNLGRPDVYAPGPEGVERDGHFTTLAFSPTDNTLAFSAVRAGRRQLYVRDLAEPEATPVPGTAASQEPGLIGAYTGSGEFFYGGTGAFFSPDGRWLGFWADRALKKVALAGGAPITLCPAWPPFGASWGKTGRIVFAGKDGGLWEIPESGGLPERLTTPEADAGETHRLPHFLPDGMNLLFTVATGGLGWPQPRIEALIAATGERRTLIEDASDARYLPTGHLLFARQGTLMAAAFDAERLTVTGEAVSLIDGVSHAVGVPNLLHNTLAAKFSVSRDGTLVYIPGGPYRNPPKRLVWVDREGKVEPLEAPAKDYSIPRLSPDGQRIAVGVTDQGIWQYDLARGTLMPVVPGESGTPLWSPDGQRLVFGAGRTYDLFWQKADGSGEPERLSETAGVPSSWQPDGSLLAFVTIDFDQGDIWLLPRGGSPRALRQTPFLEQHPAFSPDGRWLAYDSNESGRAEVYVEPYPGPGRRRQVSIDGGLAPLWAPDGRELFYRKDKDDQGMKSMMTVSVDFEPTFSIGRPIKLFRSNRRGWTYLTRNYDIAHDGRRFLMVEDVETPTPPAVTHMRMVENWFEELKARLPVS